MGLFKRKPKARKSIVDSAHDLKNEVEGEVPPSDVGLEPDEIERLLELLGRDDRGRLVFRRRVGSILDLAKGLAFWVRPNRLTVDEAIGLMHEIAEEHKIREERLLKKRRRKDPNYQLPKYLTPEEIEYPTNLSPDDVLAATDAARHRLEESLPNAEKETGEERRAKWVFEALEQLKNEEATRFARRIATMQRRHIEGKPPEEGEMPEGEGDENADVWAEHGFDDEELERIRTLQGFGKKPLKSLLDEAGDVVDGNVEAAAKVVKQWIGNTNREQE